MRQRGIRWDVAAINGEGVGICDGRTMIVTNVSDLNILHGFGSTAIRNRHSLIISTESRYVVCIRDGIAAQVAHLWYRCRALMRISTMPM